MRKLFSLFIFLFQFSLLTAQDNSTQIIFADDRENFTLVVKSVSDLVPRQAKDYNFYLKIYYGNDFIGKTEIINENDISHLKEKFVIKNFNTQPITIIAYRYIGEYYHDYFIGKAIIEKPLGGKYEIQDIATNIENNNVGTIVKGYVEVEFK